VQNLELDAKLLQLPYHLGEKGEGGDSKVKRPDVAKRE
jgi:hypothetical protein